MSTNLRNQKTAITVKFMHLFKKFEDTLQKDLQIPLSLLEEITNWKFE